MSHFILIFTPMKNNEPQKDIAAEICRKPCTHTELLKRDCIDMMNPRVVSFAIQELIRKEIIFLKKGDVMHVKKKWARVHLKDYNLGNYYGNCKENINTETVSSL